MEIFTTGGAYSHHDNLGISSTVMTPFLPQKPREDRESANENGNIANILVLMQPLMSSIFTGNLLTAVSSTEPYYDHLTTYADGNYSTYCH